MMKRVKSVGFEVPRNSNQLQNTTLTDSNSKNYLEFQAPAEIYRLEKLDQSTWTQAGWPQAAAGTVNMFT